MEPSGPQMYRGVWGFYCGPRVQMLTTGWAPLPLSACANTPNTYFCPSHTSSDYLEPSIKELSLSPLPKDAHVT